MWALGLARTEFPLPSLFILPTGRYTSVPKIYKYHPTPRYSAKAQMAVTDLSPLRLRHARAASTQT